MPHLWDYSCRGGQGVSKGRVLKGFAHHDVADWPPLPPHPTTPCTHPTVIELSVLRAAVFRIDSPPRPAPHPQSHWCLTPGSRPGLLMHCPGWPLPQVFLTAKCGIALIHSPAESTFWNVALCVLRPPWALVSSSFAVYTDPPSLQPSGGVP